MSGERLDLSSDLPSAVQHDKRPLHQSAAVTASTSRRFVGVQFACCDVYARVYLNREETAYHGNCPRCAKVVHLKIGPGGTDSRFFTVY